MNSDIPLPETKNRKDIKLFLAYVLLASVIATIVICALSAVAIRSIDDLIPKAAPLLDLDEETAETLSAIFAQLDHAELSVHHEIPAILSLIFSFGIGMILRAGLKIRRIPFALFVTAAVLIGLILAVFSLAVSIWMTDVNDIRFGDVMLSLSELLSSGIF
jgi:hypothetical protein